MAKPLTIDEVTIYDIYCLIDPETKRPRYIGKANDYKKRLQTHLQDSKRRKTPEKLLKIARVWKSYLDTMNGQKYE